MRISDWSSDVCSSDLDRSSRPAHDHPERGALVLPRRIYVNLGAFVVLFVVLMVWAVVGIIRPAALQATYPLRLAFEDATGLRPGVEATYSERVRASYRERVCQ